MPPKLADGGFVTGNLFYVHNDICHKIPGNWAETVTLTNDLDETVERPVYGDWSFTVRMLNPIGNKGIAQIMTGNRHMARKALRHMEWWRRYALKTGAKKPAMYQCVLEVTGRAWRPKMPKGGRVA